MNPFKKISLLVALLLQTFINAQPAKAAFCEVKLVFHTTVGNQPLILDSNYITPLGDTFLVTKFKYFISHLFFTDYGSAQQQSNNYFLVDENDSTSQTITLNIPDKHFTNLEFYIGVDSIKNVSGVQTGALDPATGMFWTWNSGYIMAKLEGKSPQSKAPFGNITYHIGGFRQKDYAVRKVSLSIMNRESLVVNGSLKSSISKDSGSQTHDSRFMIHDKEITININVDLNKWFNGPNPIKIAEKSFCMSPGKMAMEIADNYANMFSIKNITVK